MIDIDRVISFNKNNQNNNSDAQPTPNGASSVVDADKISPMPLVATTTTTTLMTTTIELQPNNTATNANKSIGSNDDYSGRHFFESSASYANAFNIETIVLLFMFTVCTIVYSSKYQMSPLTIRARIYLHTFECEREERRSNEIIIKCEWNQSGKSAQNTFCMHFQRSLFPLYKIPIGIKSISGRTIPSHGSEMVAESQL